MHLIIVSNIYYNKLCSQVQLGGDDEFVKISAWEKGILAATAAFLLLTIGFYWKQNDVEPYRVETQTRWVREVGADLSNSPAQIGLVNINTASVWQLQTLPGIGQVRAERIVADREENGPFRIPEDIVRVSGIGEGTLKNIIDYITVG